MNSRLVGSPSLPLVHALHPPPPPLLLRFDRFPLIFGSPFFQRSEMKVAILSQRLYTHYRGFDRQFARTLRVEPRFGSFAGTRNAGSAVPAARHVELVIRKSPPAAQPVYLLVCSALFVRPNLPKLSRPEQVRSNRSLLSCFFCSLHPSLSAEEGFSTFRQLTIES